MQGTETSSQTKTSMTGERMPQHRTHHVGGVWGPLPIWHSSGNQSCNEPTNRYSTGSRSPRVCGPPQMDNVQAVQATVGPPRLALKTRGQSEICVWLCKDACMLPENLNACSTSGTLRSSLGRCDPSGAPRMATHVHAHKHDAGAPCGSHRSTAPRWCRVLRRSQSFWGGRPRGGLGCCWRSRRRAWTR